MTYIRFTIPPAHPLLTNSFKGGRVGSSVALYCGQCPELEYKAVRISGNRYANSEDANGSTLSNNHKNNQRKPLDTIILLNEVIHLMVLEAICSYSFSSLKITH